MVIVNEDGSVCISRGDTGEIVIDFEEDIPMDGTKCVFTVKKYLTSKHALIEKTEDILDGSVTFKLTADDTKDLQFGEYWWDIRLFYETDSVVSPFCHPMTFRVTKVSGNDLLL